MLLNIVVHLMLLQCYGQGICSQLEVQPHSLVVRFAAFLPPSYLQLGAGGARHQLSLQISCEVEWLCTACADGSEHDGAHVVPLPGWLSPTTCIGPVASFSLPGNCRHRYADALPPMPRAGCGRSVYHQLVQTSRGGVPPSALNSARRSCNSGDPSMHGACANRFSLSLNPCPPPLLEPVSGSPGFEGYRVV